MKKLILLAMMAVISLTAFAQQTQKAPTDTLTLDIAKIGFLKIGDQVHDLQKEIPIFLSFQYTVTAYDFFDNAKSGLSKKEIELLQNPFKPYWEYYQKQLQQQKK